MLAEGRYDIEVPEEGALLVVSWLLANGHSDTARELLSEIGPFFPRLRFYPIPAARPREFGSRVHLQSAGQTAEAMRAVRENERILAQHEAIGVWAPLYDRMVALLSETVKGELPRVALDPRGRPLRDEAGRYAISGGWPCQSYPPDWQTRARGLIDEVRRLRSSNRRCGSLDRRKESLGGLFSLLEICAHSPRELQGRDVGRIRLLLARALTKRGHPSERPCIERRASQRMQIALPLHADLAKLIASRLDRYPAQEGIDGIAPIVCPVTREEAEQFALPVGSAVPPHLQRKVLRALRDTVEGLVERGVLTSGDMIALVAPQAVASLRSAGIRDPQLRRLYAAVYQAFRARRSLLLFNLDRQVSIEELPWVAAIETFRERDLGAREAASLALEDLSALALGSFPWAILPNKLLQELRALAKAAELDLPLVDELAADIFMGQFSAKFLESAKLAAELLRGTLYELYYGIDYGEVLRINDVRKPLYGPPTSQALADLCARRAGKARGAFDVAANGMVIEQQQILTTQNLAAVFLRVGLVQRLRPRLLELSERTYDWVVHEQQRNIKGWPNRLRMIKNTAYAWRQMIFYLSLLTDEERARFSARAVARFAEQPDSFMARFEPAIRGLERAIGGDPPEQMLAATPPLGSRAFLGWTIGTHWLMASD